MKGLFKYCQEWTDLKEYLEVYGDFVLKDPLITDEIIRETEAELISAKTFEMKDFPTDWIQQVFNKKMDERIIYEESDDMTEIYEDIFVDEEKDAIIKDVIRKMVADIRKRRNYE